IGAATGSGADAVTQKWSWDLNGQPTLATDAVSGPSGTVTRDFAYDPAGSPLAMVAPDGAVHSLTHDWVGSITSVLAPNGTQEWAYDYDPFGVARGNGLTDGGKKLTADAPANPLRYAGTYQDVTQGDRYHMGARNYDPSTGRFDSTDPVTQPATDTA